MLISLGQSRTSGFLKWSAAHRPANDDDDTGGAAPSAVATPLIDLAAPGQKLPHSPWAIPGVGGAF